MIAEHSGRAKTCFDYKLYQGYQCFVGGYGYLCYHGRIGYNHHH